MNNIIDGKLVSKNIRLEIAKEVEELKKQGITPGLAVIIVGNNPASEIYVRNKIKACEEVGIYSEKIALSENTQEDELLKIIAALNNRDDINGILVQMPLPKQIRASKVIDAISPEKDVDCFSKVNVGGIMVGEYNLMPCTPQGIMELLKAYDIEVQGKYCTVIGRSNIVGKPMAMLLINEGGTVTVCNSKTKDLKKVCLGSEIIVSAIGKAKYITKEYIPDGCVVIDVGMNRDENGKLCGDVDFENVVDKCSYITPVPGGVGPMTITMLLKNTVKACKNNM